MTTVYLVEDDQALADLLNLVVSRLGLRSRTFATGEQFLASITPDATGCVILDMRLPGMGGLEVLESLRCRGFDLPVIVVSGQPSVPMAVRAMRSGALTLLEKPFPPADLREAVNAALEFERTRQRQREIRRAVAARFAALSETERNVLEWLLRGSPNKVAAAQLGLSLRTIERHRAAALKKLSAESLVEAGAVWAMLQGAPPSDGPLRLSLVPRQADAVMRPSVRLHHELQAKGA